MNHDIAISVLDQPHPAQDEFYMGGSDTAVQQFLAAIHRWPFGCQPDDRGLPLAPRLSDRSCPQTTRRTCDR